MNKPLFTGKSSLGNMPKGPSQRQLRVAEEVRHVLADVFARTEFRDPELRDKRLTVTEVRMTPDLRNAIIYVVRLGQDNVEDLLPALKRAAPYLRSQLSQKLRLKFLPELRFHADTGLDYAAKIDVLLHSPEVLRDLDKEDE
ncbi:Ribosome-binding factor RbfA (RbfA) (PDB:1JOS) [Commensalibacter communis]|uniref:30S ribosome-binding factor RbfA n=1 Tax=Commensalibacter communis TaxID=2972786 RepID=UPI0022FFAA86|nr:30S ribosome-binding factor RbfA [Commensalibacter communis]CAI3939248.1 Ribosome-binding factor RbfA (RbfA) (PDB:1JOS) [Commensalibacter communis]